MAEDKKRLSDEEFAFAYHGSVDALVTTVAALIDELAYVSKEPEELIDRLLRPAEREFSIAESEETHAEYRAYRQGARDTMERIRGEVESNVQLKRSGQHSRQF